jgi:type I restriction enzyme M protein
MQRLGRKYPYAGWGDHQLRWIFSDKPIAYNSLGNGAGMRVSSVAYVGTTLDEVMQLSDLVTSVTHNHPQGLKAARAIAGATFLALMTRNKDKISRFIVDHIGYDMAFTLDAIRPHYRYDVTAPGSTPQAIQAFLESTSFEDAIRNAISIGGDSDTIAAMTGAIAGAYYGVSKELERQALTYLSNDLKTVYQSFKKAFID